MKRIFVRSVALFAVALAPSLCCGQNSAAQRQDAQEVSAAMIRVLHTAADQGDAKAQGALGSVYYWGIGVTQNYTEAGNWWRKAAKQGHVLSQHNLGLVYHKGQGVQLDYAEAVSWYRKAAEQGNADSQCVLGSAYYTGQGVPLDYAEAVSWYRNAAEQGNPAAQWSLGEAYLEGHGVSQSDSETKKWCGKSNQGYVAELYKLGAVYLQAHGVPLNDTEAITWIRKAAEQGNAAAQLALGVAYSNGQGVQHDITEAAQWWRKAAEQGDAKAQYKLGESYHQWNEVSFVPHNDTNDTRRKSAEADAKAINDWYRKAAVQGYAPAQCALGMAYYTGEGVQQDYSEAVTWYRKAVEQGDVEAQCGLGYAYYNGHGATKDYAEAANLFRKAAEQGEAEAQFMLAVAYRKGHGVTKDEIESEKWVHRAAEQRYGQAQIAVREIKTLKMLKMAAERGSAKTARELADFYFRAWSTAIADREMATFWYIQAANRGDAEAQILIGERYARGAEKPEEVGLSYAKAGVFRKDNYTAISWFKKAVQQGYPGYRIRTRIGEMVEEGNGYSTPDYSEAAEWFRKAADVGDDIAQTHLGTLYEKGLGVPQDFVEAYKWLCLAATGGEKDAIEKRNSLMKSLSSEQISEGQKRAANFHIKYTKNTNRLLLALVSVAGVLIISILSGIYLIRKIQRTRSKGHIVKSKKDFPPAGAEPSLAPEIAVNPSILSIACPACGLGIPANSILPGINKCPHCQADYEAET